MKLKKTAGILLLLLVLSPFGFGQIQLKNTTYRNDRIDRDAVAHFDIHNVRRLTATQKPEIRNVIVMIPDGCSTELLALGRWMNGGLPLALDSRIRGLVRTYCSDSPIGDSA
ncbi:MAG: hypothetical protein K2I87_07760, partial [Bacteroidales bacterium]|nr:hypothetical protein [Bacteroidales bacterium]